MIIKEKKEVVGKLLAQGQEFELLELNPRAGRDLSFLLREHTFEFYVTVYGIAQFIVVSRGSFAIIPYSIPEVKDVGFIVEGEEPITEEDKDQFAERYLYMFGEEIKIPDYKKLF